MLSFKNIKKYFPYFYFSVLLVVVVFTYSILSQGVIDIDERKNDEPTIEVKPVKVSLLIDYKGTKTTYVKEMKNINTFEDLLDKVREEDKLTYEKTLYRDGPVIDEIFGIKNNDKIKWMIFVDETDITKTFEDQKLEDGLIYKLKLTDL